MPESEPTEKPDLRASQSQNRFETAAEEPQLSLFAEFVLFLRENQKWWMIPILVVFGFLALVAFLMGTGLAPFVYPMM
jgi:hypothetical protein